MNKYLTINALINHAIYIIDDKFKKSDLPTELLDNLYLVAVGMIMTYGDDYIEDIYNTILEANYHSDVRFHDFLNNSKYFYNNLLDNNYLDKIIDSKSNFITIDFKYDIYFKMIDFSPIKTLEYLSYILNYILFDKNKKKSLADNIQLKINYCKANIQLKDVKEETSILDRVFNILQTEEVIKNILSIDVTKISNVKFKNIISSFHDIQVYDYRVEGLDIIVNLFRPLYRCERIKKIAMSYERDSMLKDELDKVLGKNTYQNIHKKLNKLNSITKNVFDNNTSYFEISTLYVSVRNNIIKKYIELVTT